MPCVFPVLFLKGLALLQSSSQERKHIRSHGFVYTLGILVSFWLIVAVLLALRAGGSQAGWGFQLQSPIFLTFLAAGIFFFALSLAGLFDIGLSLTSVGGDLAQKQGYTGSFFTGVLATRRRHPMHRASHGSGHRLRSSPARGHHLRRLHRTWPRPRHALPPAKPSTRVDPASSRVPAPGWRSSSSSPQSSSSPLSSGSPMSTALSTPEDPPATRASTASPSSSPASSCSPSPMGSRQVARPLDQHHRRNPHRRTRPRHSALPTQRHHPRPGPPTLSKPQSSPSRRPSRLHRLHRCLVPQLPGQRAPRPQICRRPAPVQQKHVTLLRADWTQYDPAITQQLAAVNRSGVPTYVIYPAPVNSAPDVLPELLTKEIVLTALEKDTKK